MPSYASLLCRLMEILICGDCRLIRIMAFPYTENCQGCYFAHVYAPYPMWVPCKPANRAITSVLRRTINIHILNSLWQRSFKRINGPYQILNIAVELFFIMNLHLIPGGIFEEHDRNALQHTINPFETDKPPYWVTA